MPHAIMRSRYSARLWLLAWSTFLLAALGCGADRSNEPSDSADPVVTADTLAGTDSLLATDSPAPDSFATQSTALLAGGGVPYGPYHLMNSYTTYAWGPAPFTASLNGNTFPSGVIRQIDAARAKGQKLMLSLTDGFRSHYMTDGKFDIVKWKARMNGYNTTAIKAAVARGVTDGTIIGNQVINEPNVSGWGGNINKAVVDQLCAHVKKILPTLPAGPVVVHWWRPTERYRVCDFIIDQYGWTQQSMGPGTPGGKGNVTLWRDAALTQVAKEGIKIAFSMNLLGGGTKIAGCPVPTTGGPYSSTNSSVCRMTSTQVREWGRALGPSGCAMFMWKYEATFWSKSANVQAFKDVATTLATSPKRSCRRA